MRRTVIAAVLAAGMLVPMQRAQAADGAVLDLQNAVTDVAERVRPSVVSITTETEQSPSVSPLPLPQTPTPRYGVARGTGMIYQETPEYYYVLTNAHVVRGARSREVKVQILSEREERDGYVVASDRRTDTAIVRLDRRPEDQLHTVTIGAVQDLKPGSFVIAIGSPFGFESSISFGVVSGLDRELREPTDGQIPTRQPEIYRGLIQTDASINPGNSGGPLVDMHGEVIGINFAIYSPGVAGNVGVGFAIPIDRAVRSANDIIEHGRVRRGYLGVQVVDLAEQAREMDTSLQQLRELLGVDEGAYVREVMPGTPAAKAGVQAGDVVVGLDGQTVESSGDLVDKIGAVQPGTPVKIDIMRGAERQSLDLTLAELDPDQLPGGGVELPDTPKWAKDPLGLTVAPLSDEKADELGVAKEGVLVTGVEAGGLGASRGITADTVLLRGRLRNQTTTFDSVTTYHQFVTDSAKAKAPIALWFNAPSEEPGGERRETSVLLMIPEAEGQD